MIDRGEATSAASPLIQRVPPVNLEAERAVLCSVLWDGEVMGNLVAVLKPEDFYRSGNRHIYEVMLALYDKGEPVLPVSVVEAAAFGLPIVATAVGGIPHLLEHEQTALLVPDEDSEAMAQAVTRLLQEPGLAAQLSSQGRKLAEASDWPRIHAQWQNLFSTLGS